MYPVSSRFLPRLAEDHGPVVRVILTHTDGTTRELSITGGSVTVDRGSAVRRTCSVELADVGLIPRTPADELSVYGATLRIEQGVDYGADDSETVPLGVFRITEVSGDPDDGPVTISGQGLEWVVQGDKFTEPWKSSGTAVGAVRALVQRTLPAATVISRVTDGVIGPRTFDIEADPWEAAQECAAALGAEVYADPDGVFIIAALPDLLTAAPVWSVAAGEDGVLVSANRGMSSDGVYNGVLARGENTETNSPPVSALAVDDDPTSPTYWDGPFGHRPMFYTSSTLTTQTAALSAAKLKLAAARAPNATGDLSSLPNPALEPGDVIRVVYGDGVRELHQVQSFSVPLGAGGDFSITTISAKEDA